MGTTWGPAGGRPCYHTRQSRARSIGFLSGLAQLTASACRGFRGGEVEEAVRTSPSFLGPPRNILIHGSES